ncbi:hypothetical protein TWF679_002008 [Orbilia oligospora]|uniref:Uncharacterized protein n=1 Tax=Orbilia oligospora TaxID=2813651 RepID=A0A8H8UUD9_ORBOL|nr:hypothetical protein TWF679_002008 [Orbilia oligospora]
MSHELNALQHRSGNVSTYTDGRLEFNARLNTRANSTPEQKCRNGPAQSEAGLEVWEHKEAPIRFAKRQLEETNHDLLVIAPSFLLILPGGNSSRQQIWQEDILVEGGGAKLKEQTRKRNTLLEYYGRLEWDEIAEPRRLVLHLFAVLSNRRAALTPKLW